MSNHFVPLCDQAALVKIEYTDEITPDWVSAAYREDSNHGS